MCVWVFRKAQEKTIKQERRHTDKETQREKLMLVMVMAATT